MDGAPGGPKIARCQKLFCVVDVKSLDHATAFREITSRYHSALSLGVRTCVL